ncbi:NAD(P)-binding protein [Streptomyces sp. ISL-98]|nr:NAD(P)-binding protein [Streptomyces sp. ISL-98]
MTARAGNHAVVLGGGYAGLVAARVLADRFRSVTVLEQDPVVAHAAHRKGTPQSRHPHALLARGAQVLEQFFPGLRDELTERGAPVSDFGRFPMLYPTGWSPRVSTDLVLQTFSRPVLEAAIRRRVLAHPAVSLLDRTCATGLATDAARRRVTGVRTAGTPRTWPTLSLSPRDGIPVFAPGPALRAWPGRRYSVWMEGCRTPPGSTSAQRTARAAGRHPCRPPSHPRGTVAARSWRSRTSSGWSVSSARTASWPRPTRRASVHTRHR